MKCEYCHGESFVDNYCIGCGAKAKDKKQDRKSDPFSYNGYVCYVIHHYENDTCEVQFWLGRELIERIEVDSQVLEHHVKPYEDYMPFFWDLFLVAHGEKEVLEWQEKNTKYPARFEVRRIENPEKEYLLSLNLREITKLYK